MRTCTCRYVHVHACTHMHTRARAHTHTHCFMRALVLHCVLGLFMPSTTATTTRRWAVRQQGEGSGGQDSSWINPICQSWPSNTSDQSLRPKAGSGILQDHLQLSTAGHTDSLLLVPYAHGFVCSSFTAT